MEIAEELPTLRSQLRLLEQKARDLSEQAAKISQAAHYEVENANLAAALETQRPASCLPSVGSLGLAGASHHEFQTMITVQDHDVPPQEPRFEELLPTLNSYEACSTPAGVGDFELVDLLTDTFKVEDGSFEYLSYSSATADGHVPNPDVQYQDFLASLE